MRLQQQRLCVQWQSGEIHRLYSVLILDWMLAGIDATRSLSLSLSVPFKFLRSVPLLPPPPPQTLCTRSYTYLHVPSRGFVSSTLARNAWNAAYRLKLICFCCGTAGDSDGRRWPGRVERGDRLAVGESGVRLFFDDIGFD